MVRICLNYEGITTLSFGDCTERRRQIPLIDREARARQHYVRYPHGPDERKDDRIF